MSGRINFLTMKVLKNAITKSSSSRGHFNRKPDKTRASGIFIFFVTLI